MRRWAVLTALLASAWTTGHGQSLPGTPVRPAGPPPIGTLPRAVRPGGVVLGEVVDATSGRGVAHAVVRVSATGVALTRVTDDKGRFYFTNLPDADLTIVATKIGFFDGAYGKRRAGGAGVPFTMSNGQWAADLRLELFKAAAISGIVSDETNEPIAGVRVRAWRREFDEGREQLAPAGDAFTDDAGLYRIFGLEPGDYILGVPAVQVTLPLAAANGASAGGSAEASALLGLNRASDPNDRRVQPDGRHVLIAGRNATEPPPDHGLTFAYRTEFHPGFEVPSDALPVTVGPGDDRIGVHFQLHLVETHRVSGIVVGREGPLAHQLVRLVLDGADDQGFGSEAATTMTDTDGTFALLNVPGGRYTLEVRALGSVPGAASPAAAVALDDVSPAASATRGWGRAPVAVRDADVDSVIVAVRPGGAIDGRLVVEGERQPSSAQLSRLTIGLLPADRGVGGALATHLDSVKRFGFSNLVPAPYFLRVRDTPPGWSVKSLTAGGRDLLDQPLDLEDAAEVVVTLTDHPTEIWGMVRDWRGVPTSGATVLVLPAPASGNAGLNPNRMREVRAATSGVYTIAGLPAGEYSIVAIDDAAAEGWQDPRRADALRVLGTRVTLRAGEKTMIDLRLPRK